MEALEKNRSYCQQIGKCQATRDLCGDHGPGDSAHEHSNTSRRADGPQRTGGPLAKIRMPSSRLAIASARYQTQPSSGFSYDVQALKDCKPGDCLIQMPANSIQELHQ